MKNIFKILLGASLTLISCGTSAQTVKPVGIVNGIIQPITSTQITRASTDWVNALGSGVTGDGITDDGPAIRTLFANVTGKTIFFPPNHTYLIATNVTPGSYPASDNAGFLISQQSNFHVIANGATFQVTNAIPLTATAFMDRDVDWTWDGGNFVGTRTGLTSGQENVAIALMNNQRFRISDVTVASGFGGLGAAFAGDWNVAGQLSNLHLNGVGICFDVAFNKSMTFRDIVATGADTNGANGTGQIGNKCYSDIYDVPLSSYNLTGISYTETNGVTVQNLDASNFGTGVALAAGQNFSFVNVNLHDNPGSSASSVPGIGYYFYYNNGGVSTSVGFPLGNVSITGGQVTNNGNAMAGYGILIDSSAIANSDVMTGFNINGVALQNNASTGISTNGSAIAGLYVVGVGYNAGTHQSTSISQGAINIAQQVATTATGGLATHLITGSADLCNTFSNLSPISGTTSYNWSICASSTNGNFYIYDQSSNKILFSLAQNSTSAIETTADGRTKITGSVQEVGTTYAALPTCGTATAGTQAFITDASTAITAWHQAVTTGGGTNKASILCNGSGWFSTGY